MKGIQRVLSGVLTEKLEKIALNVLQAEQKRSNKKID